MFRGLMLEHLAAEDAMVPQMRRSFTQQEERQVRCDVWALGSSTVSASDDSWTQCAGSGSRDLVQGTPCGAAR